MSEPPITPPLSPFLVTRKLGEVEFKSIPQRTTRALAIFEKEDVTLADNIVPSLLLNFDESSLRIDSSNKSPIPEISGIAAYRQELARILPMALNDANHPKTIQPSFRQSGTWPTNDEPLLVALQKFQKKQGVSVRDQLGRTKLSLEEMREMANEADETASGKLFMPLTAPTPSVKSKQTTLDAFIPHRHQKVSTMPASKDVCLSLPIQPCKREESTPDFPLHEQQKSHIQVVHDDDEEQ
ncbi:hypothetical protein BLNAU_8689 [Blattamonas nauphoetae]|uniref:Peptidoglycan binding-like domain-containing protein n=1 Tax=Blattamonas nauphoetae TaxID=2049346 RepID=A0ABQ9XXU1_9EUKA|nr:hypothetical protein BLNAU_8689 [Blattamonas nauphoetae]